MKNLKPLILFLTLIFLWQFYTNAQVKTTQVPIPFRIGDKFGVVNETGVFLIKPQFDWIIISDFRQKFLTGYNLKNNTVLSSLIYQNKILLFNQPYEGYFLTNGLFIAQSFEIIDPQNPVFSKRFTQQADLFTIDGKKLVQGKFTDIVILDDIDQEGQLNQTLVNTLDTAKKQSLFIYDKKLKKITQKFITNASYLNITNNSERNYMNKSYTIIFRDEQGNGHQLQIVNDGKSLRLTSDKTIAIAPEQTRNHEYNPINDDNPFVDFPDYSKPFKSDSTGIKSNGSNIIDEYQIKGHFYYFPKRVEQLQNGIALSDSEVPVTINGKKGLKNLNTGLMEIPAEYDQIIKGDFEGLSGGYVLRLGKTYKIAYNKDKFFINPTIFNKVPLAITNYFDDGSPLIKLYNDNGLFFCYANAAGKVYYSDK